MTIEQAIALLNEYRESITCLVIKQDRILDQLQEIRESLALLLQKSENEENDTAFKEICNQLCQLIQDDVSNAQDHLEIELQNGGTVLAAIDSSSRGFPKIYS